MEEGGAATRTAEQKKEADGDARRVELHAWQRFYNMEPRSDSLLTERYLEGALEWSAAEVARELASTHFLHTYTCYGAVIEDFMRGMANRVRSRHGLSWTATWRLVRFYGPFALKILALLRASTRIPRALPPPSPPKHDPDAAAPPHAPSA